MTVATAFRDYLNDGVPGDGPHKPIKKEIREALLPIEAAVNSFLANGGLVYLNRADLYADIGHGDSTMAWVITDATIAYNGIYQKSGGVGLGSWARLADLPYNCIRATDSGAGTANAIIATSSFPVSDGVFVAFSVFEANTASPVTVAFNGQAALTIKTAGGSNVAVAGLVSGVQVFGVRIGTTFRLLNDQASAAIVAAAEDAADRAEAAAIAAENSSSTNNKILTGSFEVRTNAARTAITSGTAPFNPEALFHVNNVNLVTAGIRSTSYWTGTTALPYQNNDSILSEVYNSIVSTSLNRSWAGSFANAYNNIPLGVTDSGERTGVIGWSVSVNLPGYSHAGTLAQQIGVHGSCGFQASGTPATAVITNAVGVRGVVYSDSAGATITDAYAVQAVASSYIGVVANNHAVFADAFGGTTLNYSFFGARGVLHNANQVQAGASSVATQSSSSLSVRGVSNSLEFGHPDPAGYGSNIGATFASGFPFLAMCAEAEASGDTFRTRGKLGTLIFNDLLGSVVFARLTNANASGQSHTESARIDPTGHLLLAETPYLATKTPASAGATGTTGEIGWDSSYIYVCVATNAWKRTAIATW